MGFWTDALDDLGDNLSILVAAGGDVADELNPFSDGFADGKARRVAEEVERQNAKNEGREYDPSRVERSEQGGIARIKEGVVKTGEDVSTIAKDAAKDALDAAGTGLDLLSNKWFWYGLGAVAVVGVVAVYGAPLLKAAKAVVPA
jgi:hypothetical protein